MNWTTLWVLACGVAVQFWIGTKIGKGIGVVVAAAILACSYTRFAWACGRVHGFKRNRFPPAFYAPQVWASFFLAELGGGKAVVSMGGSGVWNGFGNWTVFPRKDERGTA